MLRLLPQVQPSNNITVEVAQIMGVQDSPGLVAILHDLHVSCSLSGQEAGSMYGAFGDRAASLIMERI